MGARFTQADVTRAAKGAIAAGLPVSRTEIAADGRIVIYHDATVPADNLSPFEKWKADKDASAAQRR